MVAMCFSLWHVPRSRIRILAKSWWDSFHTSGIGRVHRSSFTLLGSYNSGLEEHSRKWSSRTANAKVEGRHEGSLSSKTSNILYDVSDGTVSATSELNINKTKICEFERIRYHDTRQKIAENSDLAKLITVIVFDIETTGFSRDKDSIIEIALQDLLGGQNSTFQTLVNPDRYVPNPHIHGISTNMVNKPGVPRMKDLIPILLQYVRSRQKPDGLVLFVAHNARCFDVPFLISEFSRCFFEIPSDWLFLDTLPLAREVMKNGVPKPPSKLSLQDLRQHYQIPLNGSAHRAMSDVMSLSSILQKLTFDLKLPVSGLVERSFTASDINAKKKTKKKNSS